MIITLQKKYNTACAISKNNLLEKLKSVPENNPQLLSVRGQIEQALIVSEADLEIYECCVVKKPNITPFSTQFTAYSAEQLAGRSYTFLKGICYILPHCDEPENMVYALIDKLVYEAMRHGMSEEPCVSLKAVIGKFMPESKKYTLAKFSAILAEQEASSATYYAECLSDDSDGDEEEHYQNVSKEKKDAQTLKALQYRHAAHSNTFFSAFSNQTTVTDKYTTERPAIPRQADFKERRRQILSDLGKINEHINQGKAVDGEFLESLPTQFLVAQYRGIHYVTSRWDAAARREHRNLDEVGKPQYSSAVFNLTGVKDYHDMLNKMRADPGFSGKLAQTAKVIEELLLNMQQSAPCSFEGYAYSNLFLVLQKKYSADYDGFPNWVATELKRKNSLLAAFLKTNERPLFSTSDVPNHALKYAFGVKLYEGHQDERLRPRWRDSLRAERPYSGKAYLSLHPLTDYEEHKPSHLTSLFKQGLVSLPNVIVAERETSFLGYMPADRVAYHFKAKYPSFEGQYKEIFFYKYGINKHMYTALQEAFENFAPHTTERRNVIKSLGDYLVAYNEVRLVAKAEKMARKQGKILIYRDENGLYSLYLPDTPTTGNKRLGPLIAMEREVYKSIAGEKNKSLQVMSRKDFDDAEEKVRYIQDEFQLLLKNDYTICALNVIELSKLKLLNKTLQKLIIEDADNLSLILSFPLAKLTLCSNGNLLKLLKKEYITLEQLDECSTRALARLVTFDNLQKPLSEGYSLKELLGLLKEDEWHIRCLTAESLEDLIIDEFADIPDLVLQYAEQKEADFEFILDTLSATERMLFSQRLEKFRPGLSDSEDESSYELSY